ncbi:MAG TPA: hypothetical protein VF850_12600 [Gemmatimonadaceae bacterium]
MNGTGVADKSAPREEGEKSTQYSVAPPPPESNVEAARKRIAIFVAHGMGQQIPFETLDAIAESLRAHDESVTSRREKPVSKSVRAGDQWLQRVELNLKSGAEQIEAHVYEGYWAPLTEGKITLRQVLGFLTGAASNGMKIARKTFKRWLMGEYHSFPTPIRILLYLMVASAMVGALVALNSTILAVAAVRTLFSQRPWWLTNGLFADLTTTFNAVVTTMVVFGASLLIAHLIRRPRIPVIARRIWGWVTVAVFFLTLLAIILAGVSVLSLLFLHVRGNVAADTELWQRFLSKDWIDHFNARFDSWGLWSVLAVVFVTLLLWVIVLLPKLRRDLADPRGRILTIAVLLAFTLVVVAIIVVALRFFGVLLPWTENLTASTHGIAWPLLVIASGFIRVVLVQFVGDVAIYVMPYKLDAFNDLRKEIKDVVYKVAHAVYALKDKSGKLVYDRVIVLGHSLGSVIAYDGLNRLILEDGAAAPDQVLNVVNRTPLFLTFGSPLNKTAFIFGAQGHGTTEARESLAASVQPLIQDYKFRPDQWINIYSPWDIISGYLDLYDLPDSTSSKKVNNLADPEATTLLMAHTEYWNNSLLVKTLYDAL